MTHAFVVLLAVLGVVGQALAVILLVIGALALAGIRGPLEWLRATLWGYELWCAFVVTAIATAGSLFFSGVAGFVPGEPFWYQRIRMYPLSILTPFAPLTGHPRNARHLFPVPRLPPGTSPDLPPVATGL